MKAVFHVLIYSGTSAIKSRVGINQRLLLRILPIKIACSLTQSTSSISSPHPSSSSSSSSSLSSSSSSSLAFYRLPFTEGCTQLSLSSHEDDYEEESSSLRSFDLSDSSSRLTCARYPLLRAPDAAPFLADTSVLLSSPEFALFARFLDRFVTIVASTCCTLHSLTCVSSLPLANK